MGFGHTFGNVFRQHYVSVLIFLVVVFVWVVDLFVWHDVITNVELTPVDPDQKSGVFPYCFPPECVGNRFHRFSKSPRLLPLVHWITKLSRYWLRLSSQNVDATLNWNLIGQSGRGNVKTSWPRIKVNKHDTVSSNYYITLDYTQTIMF